MADSENYIYGIACAQGLRGPRLVKYHLSAGHFEVASRNTAYIYHITPIANYETIIEQHQ